MKEILRCWIEKVQELLEVEMQVKKGVEMCRTLCRHLSNKYVVVSGLAKGIDSIAHQCSLNRGTIGVIGCGLDVIYPKQNEALYKTMRKNHLILSEYPKGVAPLAFHFPWRNRILAALSDVVIVVEAKKKKWFYAYG